MLKRLFTENKLIKREIKQDIDHFQFSLPLFNTIVFLVFHKGLLNGKLRCVLVRIFIYLGRNYCMLEREIMLLEILEDVLFYKNCYDDFNNHSYFWSTCCYGVLYEVILPCGSHAISEMGIMIPLLPIGKTRLSKFAKIIWGCSVNVGAGVQSWVSLIAKQALRAALL